MNISKARDFYSAYHEGTLDEGLREAFERAMVADPAIADEYASFSQVYNSLNPIESEVEIPHDLHESIMARIDKTHWEQKQTASSALFGRWRGAFVGALAVAGIVTGILSLNAYNRGVAEAGLGVSLQNRTTEVDISHVDNQFELTIEGRPGSKFVVRRADSGEALEEVTLKQPQQSIPLDNESAKAAPIEVVSPAGDRYLLVVLPGKSRESNFHGEGTLLDLGRVLAGTYRMPVVLRSPDSTRNVKWDFAKSDGFRQLGEKLKTSGATLSLREDGIALLADF